MAKRTETVIEQLSLSNKVFADTRIKMDAALNMAINKLVELGLRSGTVALRIKMEVETKVTDDGEIIHVPSFEPKVSMKIGAGESLDCFVPKGLIMKRGRDGKNLVCENQISMDEVVDDKKGA